VAASWVAAGYVARSEVNFQTSQYRQIFEMPRWNIAHASGVDCKTEFENPLKRTNEEQSTCHIQLQMLSTR
jgi:hypothetical protein